MLLLSSLALSSSIHTFQMIWNDPCWLGIVVPIDQEASGYGKLLTHHALYAIFLKLDIFSVHLYLDCPLVSYLYNSQHNPQCQICLMMHFLLQIHLVGLRWYQEDFSHKMILNFTTNSWNPELCLNLSSGSNYTVNISTADLNHSVPLHLSIPLAGNASICTPPPFFFLSQGCSFSMRIYSNWIYLTFFRALLPCLIK